MEMINKLISSKIFLWTIGIIISLGAIIITLIRTRGFSSDNAFVIVPEKIYYIITYSYITFLVIIILFFIIISRINKKRKLKGIK